ncbi:MAG: hypothetical protein MJY71_08185 [Bacteroidaceae bacterium]|nr:hypothetical protein [Bacteroidaceae bacterium]
MTFPTKCGKWLVKNFSENDLFVSFEEDATEAESVKIAAGMGQVVVDNEYLNGEAFKHKSIYLSGNGEVEVQQLCHEP